MSKYFKDAEFRRCTPACSIEDMDKDFLALMDEVREEAGIPLVVNSAYRSRAWEKLQGRNGNSSHTRGVAVDIRCTTSQNRWKILRAAFKCGIRRIGVARNFIHLDNDPTLPQRVVWHYYD